MKRPDCFGGGFNDVLEMCTGSCEYVEECSNSDGYSSTCNENKKRVIKTSIGNFNPETEAIEAFEERFFIMRAILKSK